jgi:RimJ/RimL family protein N-acetyltransferase
MRILELPDPEPTHLGLRSYPPFAGLQTARIALRTYSPSDAELVWQGIEESRSSLLRWVPDIGRRVDAADVRRALASLASPRAQEHRLVLGVWDRLTSAFLGEVGIYDLDRAAGMAEIGYWIRRTARGHGYATEALRTLLEHARRELGVERFEAHIAVDNASSRRVAERLGFRLEGQRAPAPRWDGEVGCVLVYVCSAAAF